MGLVETVAPTANPVSLDEVKAHLRIEHSYDDDFLTTAIGEAVDYIQSMTRHQLMSATYRYTLDSFPNGDTITLPMAKAQSVTSVQYVDTAGSTQTFASSNYSVDVDSKPARIVLIDNSSWASIKDVPAAVTITYVAGYSSAGNVPSNAKVLLKALVGQRYENRELTTMLNIKELPFTGQVLFNQLTFHEAV